MHPHFSLFEDDTNAFHDPDDEISSPAMGPWSTSRCWVLKNGSFGGEISAKMALK